MKRILSAAVLLPLLVLYVMKLPPGYFALLVAVMSSLALFEFFGMYKVPRPLKYTGAALGLLVIAAGYWGEAAVALLASFVIAAAVRLFAVRGPDGALSDIGIVVAGLLYIPGLLGYHMALRSGGAALVLYLYASVWLSDAFALYAGKALGKRKLYPSISPNKTVAGAVGSVLGGTAGALAVKLLLLPEMAFPTALVTGAALGVLSIVGDLIESMFKRDAGVKDSAGYIPGHGGMLDKLDGPLVSGMVLYWMFRALKVVA
jgi:phosphatidate cytidylyltransferase